MSPSPPVFNSKLLARYNCIFQMNGQSSCEGSTMSGRDLRKAHFWDNARVRPTTVYNVKTANCLLWFSLLAQNQHTHTVNKHYRVTSNFSQRLNLCEWLSNVVWKTSGHMTICRPHPLCLLDPVQMIWQAGVSPSAAGFHCMFLLHTVRLLLLPGISAHPYGLLF